MYMVLSLFFLLLYFCYVYLTQHFDYFKRRNVPGPTPIPLFGNMWGSWRGKFHEEMLENTKKYGHVFGFFKGMVPCLSIADPKLLRNIFIKDFDSFAYRSNFDVETKFSKKVVAFLRGQDWKVVRGAVAASFTTAKIKLMTGHLNDKAVTLCDHLRQLNTKDGKVNLKLEFGTYVADIIAVCTCATTTNSIGNKDHPLVVNAQACAIPEGPMITLVYLYETFGKILAKLNLMVPFKYFLELGNYLVTTKMAEPNRKEGNELLSQLISTWEKHKGTNHILADPEVITAQISAVFATSFDTTAIALTATLHCIAHNPEIQNKARQNVLESFQKYGSWSYEMVQDLKYIDYCITEGLRLYPPAYVNQRRCEKDIEYDGLSIKKGTLVCIPIYAIHRNPEFYTEPDKFIPERFRASEKGERDPMLFQGFGHGPRSCFGQRFSIMAMRIMIGQALSKFEFFPVAESKDPIPFRAATWGLLLVDELWLGIKPLADQN